MATFRRGGWEIEQMTDSVAPVENRAGSLGKRGRLIVFSSNGNYTGQNGDGNREIFLLDKDSFEQVSMTTAGESANPTVNTRGRFVAFESTADADAAGATLTNRRVFLFDRKNGTTRSISRSLFGDNFKPRISNGRFVVWESTSNLTGSNPGAERVIYLYDRRKDN
jgi:Tol biopolymer transport system component